MSKSTGYSRSYRARQAANGGAPLTEKGKRVGSSAGVSIGQSVTLPAGTQVGMGRLREATSGVVTRVESGDSGAYIVAVRFRAKNRRGKEEDRITWVTLR